MCMHVVVYMCVCMYVYLNKFSFENFDIKSLHDQLSFSIYFCFKIQKYF